MTETIQYRDKKDVPQGAVLDLYRANNWSSANKSDKLHQALLNSHSLVTAWSNDRLVGLANAISDGFLVVYYPHVVVHPDYQRQGIGRAMMARLMRQYEGFHQHSIIADKNAVAFFEVCGSRGQSAPPCGFTMVMTIETSAEGVAMTTDQVEAILLECLDRLFHAAALRQSLDQIVERVERRLDQDLQSAMAWEPVPLDTYGVELPPSIRSSWIFILRANTASGAERHPNSRQRMMSYRGSGDLQTQVSLQDEWSPNRLVSRPDAPLAQRWISIPPNVWHQAVVPEANWVVVSFHTASEEELLEERPGTKEGAGTVQRRYADRLRAKPSASDSIARPHRQTNG